MKKQFTQSITAYRCKICEKYSNEDLLLMTSKKHINLEKLLFDFFEYIKKCKIDSYTRRAIMLSKKASKISLNNQVTRIHIQPDAGKSFENFSVVNHSTNSINKYKGEENSAVYSHNVLFYIAENANVFLFHRYGQSGCKTAFLNTFNEFLSTQGLMAHLDVLLSNEMFEGQEKYIPEKISLITTYSEEYTDKSDNSKEKEKKKIEQETIISLNAPRANNIREWFANTFKKEPTIDELKQILIEDSFPGDFDDAKVTVKFGKVRRKISLSDFSGLIAEYDITDKLEIGADGIVKDESLYQIADEYAASFIK